MKRARATLLVAAFAAAMATSSPLLAAEEAGTTKLALEIDIDGAIGPATARQVKEALAAASERNFALSGSGVLSISASDASALFAAITPASSRAPLNLFRIPRSLTRPAWPGGWRLHTPNPRRSA